MFLSDFDAIHSLPWRLQRFHYSNTMGLCNWGTFWKNREPQQKCLTYTFRTYPETSKSTSKISTNGEDSFSGLVPEHSYKHLSYLHSSGPYVANTHTHMQSLTHSIYPACYI